MLARDRGRCLTPRIATIVDVMCEPVFMSARQRARASLGTRSARRERMLRLAPLALLATLAIGCGPYMQRDTVNVLAFQSPERCGQGPYDIVVPARGARWGEGISVIAYSPRAIAGRYEIREGDEVIQEGSFQRREVPTLAALGGGGDEYTMSVEDEPADNARCLAPDAEGAIGEGALEGTPSAPVATSGGEVTGSTDTVTASLELSAVPWTGPYELGRRQMRDRGVGIVRIGSASWSQDDPEDATPPIAEGTPLRIRLWSNLPNDLEGVTFVVAQTIQQPSVPDEQWVAYLREQREALQREADARAEESRRRSAEWHAHCQAHHEDEQCWGPGGYDGAVERQRRAQLDAPRRAREREEEARRIAREVAALPPAPPPPPPAEPEGPPPPPRAEARPPQPSAHATWTPGYWRWHAARWVWVGGSWDVPAEDLERHETVQAPAAPPPPQVETAPAPPAPEMVWVPGYWQWDGARFVWIAGRWDLPRQAGATWRAPSWRVGPGGASFVPGRWEVRVGR